MQEENLNNKNNKLLIIALGKLVKKHRLAKNKSIYKISAESQMSKGTWRDVELGVGNDVNLTTIWKIAEGLYVKIDILFNELLKELDENFTLTDL